MLEVIAGVLAGIHHSRGLLNIRRVREAAQYNGKL